MCSELLRVWINWTFEKNFKLNSRPSRYNSLKLIKPRALTSHKHISLSHRVINNWNELPDSVVVSDNVNMFKRNLDFLEG